MARREKNYRYYVLREGEKVYRIARIGADGAFGWDAFRWIPMNGLHKIEWEVTDYDDITKEEADRLIADKRARTEYYGWLVLTNMIRSSKS